MKKTLIVIFAVVLLATACKKHGSDSKQNSGCMYKLTIKGYALGNEIAYDQFDPTTISVTVDGHTYTQSDTAIDGSFSMVVNRCSVDTVPVKVYAIDKVTGDSSNQSLPPFDSTTFMADTGTLVIRSLYAMKQDQWIYSDEVNLVSRPDNISFGSTGFSGNNPFDPFMNIQVSVATPMTGTGTYAVTNFQASYASSPDYRAGTNDGTPPAGTVTITSFGTYVAGTFSVPVHTSYGDATPADQFTFNGSFQFKR